MTTKIPKSLLPVLREIVAQVPLTVTLTVARQGEPTQEKEYHPLSDGGSFLALWSGGAEIYWGRADTLWEAIDNLIEAGGRTIRDALRKPGVRPEDFNMILQWQPREAWVRHGEIYPERAKEVGPPDINGHWGSPRPVTFDFRNTD